jgi:hypothetical protein
MALLVLTLLLSRVSSFNIFSFLCLPSSLYLPLSLDYFHLFRVFFPAPSPIFLRFPLLYTILRVTLVFSFISSATFLRVLLLSFLQHFQFHFFSPFFLLRFFSWQLLVLWEITDTVYCITLRVESQILFRNLAIILLSCRTFFGSDLLFVHLTTMIVVQNIQHRMVGSLQNCELVGMCKETVVLSSKVKSLYQPGEHEENN